MGLQNSILGGKETKQLIWYGHVQRMRQQMAQTRAEVDATRKNKS
jgi:hypothetical protein